MVAMLPTTGHSVQTSTQTKETTVSTTVSTSEVTDLELFDLDVRLVMGPQLSGDLNYTNTCGTYCMKSTPSCGGSCNTCNTCDATGYPCIC